MDLGGSNTDSNAVRLTDVTKAFWVRMQEDILEGFVTGTLSQFLKCAHRDTIYFQQSIVNTSAHHRLVL